MCKYPKLEIENTRSTHLSLCTNLEVLLKFENYQIKPFGPRQLHRSSQIRHIHIHVSDSSEFFANNMVPTHQMVAYIFIPKYSGAKYWFLRQNLIAYIYHVFSSLKFAKTWFLRRNRRFAPTFIWDSSYNRKLQGVLWYIVSKTVQDTMGVWKFLLANVT